jgi:hypothetical protein
MRTARISKDQCTDWARQYKKDIQDYTGTKGQKCFKGPRGIGQDRMNRTDGIR